MTKEEWQAIKARDKSMDGVFYCGAVSQKIFCRISCSKVRKISNTCVFASPQDAIKAGYKPCQRCRPDDPNWKGTKAALASAAQKYMEAHFHDKFSLEQLSSALFVNGSYLLRTFKQITGQTPLWYHNHLRCEKAKELLTHNELSISAVGDLCGFVSSAHFSHVFKKMLGETPSQYRKEYLLDLDREA